MRIAILQDGPWMRPFAETRLIHQEIRALLTPEYQVRFPPDKQVHGHWSVARIQKTLAQLLADPTVDVVLTMGVIASHQVSQQRQLPKPVIAPLVLDATLQDLPRQGQGSGIKNLNYIVSYKSLARDVKVFQEIFAFQHLTVLSDALLLKSMGDIIQKTHALAEQYGIEIKVVAVDDSIDTALKALPANTDAVYVTPLLRLSSEAIKQLAQGLIERKLPSFSMYGRPEVEWGLLASVAPVTDSVRFARRIALNIQRILMGEPASTLPVTFAESEHLTLNMATARAIGVSPSWQVLTAAELLHPEPVIEGAVLFLTEAVHQAVNANLELNAARYTLTAEQQSIHKAESVLKPQVEMATQGLQIDQDRAAASRGQYPERALSVSIGAKQLVYSESATANVAIVTHAQRAREQAFEQLRLDIIQTAATAYLHVLQSKTLEDIERENLALSRTHLKMARIRRRIGTSGPADIYRLEREIATHRKNLLKAQVQHQQAQLKLNKVLHRPLTEPLKTAEPSLTDPHLLISQEDFFDLIDDPQSFATLSDFMVQEGLTNAPELQHIEAEIEAKTRSLLSARRAFWSPTLALTGDVSHTLSRDGAGKQLPPGVNQTDWQLALTLSLPLYRGGSKSAELTQIQEQLAQLRTQRQVIQEQLETQIRSALHTLTASYPAIALSKAAAQAAQQHLELVSDAYARGTLAILDLVEAQNAALVSEQLAANARYAFLIDLMTVQRHIGQFDFFMSPQERQAWLQRLHTFFDQQ
ncbi:MAG: TolC family protein [Pseudomonadota bacterium]|nr:TolC family protein [Pseudomonadota bacterium]